MSKARQLIISNLFRGFLIRYLDDMLQAFVT
jgi:hypothetical protein